MINRRAKQPKASVQLIVFCMITKSYREKSGYLSYKNNSMEISKAEAERLLGVSATTLYNRANKMNIKFINKVDSKGKSSYLNQDDLKKMAEAMGKTLKTESTPEKKKPKTENRGAEESEDPQQHFMLQLKIKEQEEVIKSNNQMIEFYKEQNGKLQNFQQQAQIQMQDYQEQVQIQFNTMHKEITTLSTK